MTDAKTGDLVKYKLTWHYLGLIIRTDPTGVLWVLWQDVPSQLCPCDRDSIEVISEGR